MSFAVADVVPVVVESVICVTVAPVPRTIYEAPVQQLMGVFPTANYSSACLHKDTTVLNKIEHRQSSGNIHTTAQLAGLSRSNKQKLVGIAATYM